MERPRAMPAALLALLVVQVALAAADPCAEPSPPVRMVNVSFPSAVVPSGSFALHGTLVLPPAGGPVLAAAVLVTGSGPNDRWSTQGAIRMYHDFAVSLASRGAAVLAYDKRTCTAGNSPLCSTVVCGPTTGDAGCLVASLVAVTDFVGDAVAAARFLLGRPEVPAGLAVSLVGHSQGVNVVPSAAAELLPARSTVVLLSGAGVPIDVVLRDQSALQLPLLEEELQQVEAQPPSPQRDQFIAQLTALVATTNCTVMSAVQQFDLLRSGAVGPDEPHALLCPIGSWNGGNSTRPGLYCPALCGTGVCAAGNNTNECIIDCTVAFLLGGCQRPLFYSSWLGLTEPAAQSAVLRSLTGNVLALNSNADLLVPPPDFAPLHALLANISVAAAASGRVVSSVTVDGLSHELVSTDGGLCVRADVLATVGDFIGLPPVSPDDGGGGGGGGWVLIAVYSLAACAAVVSALFVVSYGRRVAVAGDAGVMPSPSSSSGLLAAGEHDQSPLLIQQ